MIAYQCICPQNGFTALHLAVQEGKVDVMKQMTEAKAHVNIQTEVYTCTYIYMYIHFITSLSVLKLGYSLIPKMYIQGGEE